MTDFKVNLIIPEDVLEECKIALNDWFGIAITDEQLRTMLEKDSMLAADLAENQDVDTVVRENLAESVLNNILGITRSWPMGRSSVEYKKSFYTELFQKAEEHNLELNWSEEDKAKRL